MTVQQEARNANLQDMVALLDAQQQDKLDLVVPATAIRSRNGLSSVAQTVSDPDLAADLEATAVKALDLAPVLA